MRQALACGRPESPREPPKKAEEIQDYPMKRRLDQWWEWAEKPLDSHLTIPAKLQEAVTALSESERCNRTRVN